MSTRPHCFGFRFRGLLVWSFAAALLFLMARRANAASLQMVSNWGATGVPTYISMYIYVPDKVAANPPILVVAHFCGGSASAVFGQAQGGGIVAAADKYGFIMILPQTTNPATSAKCWDVGSKQSLTHDGGGDTQAVAQMVKHAVTTYKANANRVYVTGDSSGGMMTQALLAVYPDVFKAGASFAGVPAGCWSAGWSAASNWGGTCAGGNDTMTAQQWGDLARAMYPGYTGHRPRVQLFHGDADAIINYKNFVEAIKEWTNVLGLSTTPTTTTMGLTLGMHQATRQQWKDACGGVALDAFTSIGGDHGPSDAIFNASYVIPFLGLDKAGDVDPQVAACTAGNGGGGGGGGGAGGTGSGMTGTGGAAGRGGRDDAGIDGGVDGAGTGGTKPPAGSGGSNSGGGPGATGGTQGSGGSGADSVAHSGGATGSGGKGSGGTDESGTGGGASAGTSGSGGAAGSGPAVAGPGSSGCACAIGPGPYKSRAEGHLTAVAALGIAIVTAARRTRRARRKTTRLE